MVQAKPTTPQLNTGDPLYPYLICALPFNDGTLTIAHDLSGLGYNGTLTGGASWIVDSTLGTVVQLDGSTGFVTLSSLLNAALLASSNGVAVSMWLKLRNNQPTVATKTGLMQIQSLNTGAKASKYPAGGTVTGETNGTGYISTFRDGTLGRVTVNLGATDKSQWHLLTICSQPGGNWTIFINGVQLTTTPATITSSNPIGATLTALLGQSPSDTNGGPYFLDGWLGDFRAYAKVLTAPEVLSLFNSPWNLYTLTATIGQARISAISVDATSYKQASADRSTILSVDALPGTRGDGATARTFALSLDTQYYHDPGTSPLAPNDPGLTPLNENNAFNPRLKPDNTSAPVLNADSINTGSVLALPLNEGANGSAVAPTLALSAGGTLAVTTFFYAYSYVSAAGESSLSPVASITTTGVNKTVGLSTVANGPAGVTAKNIYRATTNSRGSFALIGTIPDNTTTIFTDNGLAAGSTGPLEVNDRSGNNNHGFLVASASWDTSVSSFYYKNRVKAPAISTPNGSGSFVRIPRSVSLEPAAAITVSAWIRPHGFPNTIYGVVVGKPGSNPSTYYSYLLGLGNGGNFFFYLTDVLDAGTPAEIRGGSYPNSQNSGPYFIVGSYDGSLVKLYVNGVLVNSIGDSGAIIYAGTPGDLYIAGDPFNVNCNCDVEEVRIWNRALSLTEIQAMYGSQHTATTNPGSVPATDPASGPYGAYSNGSLYDQLAISVDACPNNSNGPGVTRLLSLSLDVQPNVGDQISAERNIALSVDMQPVAINVTFMGAWSSSVAYSVGQIVSYNSQNYVATQAGTNHQPDTSPTFWSPYALSSMGIATCTPNSGSFVGGTTVLITGQFFRNVIAVFIGGTLCPSFTVLNDQLIQATTAAHAAGQASVRVDSTTYGTVVADRLFQYVGGLVTATNALFRGKQWTTSLWHQDPPGSFYTNMTATLVTDTILPFTLADKPVSAQAVEVYVRHVSDPGYSRMRYLLDWDIDITNQRITWKSTAAFGLVPTDEMIVVYPGQN